MRRILTYGLSIFAAAAAGWGVAAWTSSEPVNDSSVTASAGAGGGSELLPLEVEPQAAQTVIKTLAEAKIAATYDEAARSVSVSVVQRDAALDALALAGVLPGAAGFELSDVKADPVKQPESYRKQMYLALQNTLAGMIGLFPGVEGCGVRIHDEEPVRADVTLRLSRPLTESLRDQIVGNVVSVVEKLEPANVRLVDEAGQELKATHG